MAVSDLSPNVDNYIVGKGVMKVKNATDIAWVDVGNVPLFEVTITVTKLAHYSSRLGIRKKDREVVTEAAATVRWRMEEFTSRNLSMAYMGDYDDVSGTIDILTATEQVLAIRFVGANTIGGKMQIDLPVVSISPAAAIPAISDEWGAIEMSGEIAADEGTGSFGKIYTNIDAEQDT